MRSRKTLVWIFALCTATPLATSLWVSRIPNVPHVLLAGEWRIHEGTRADWSDPAFDDSAWQRIHFPGRYAQQGFSATECWIRKDFDLPESLRHQKLYLLFADLLRGTGNVYVNGHLLSEQGLRSRDLKFETEGVTGIDIPAEFLVAEHNVMAVHVHWPTPVASGILERRIIIGTDADLKPYFHRDRVFHRVVQYGAIFFFLFAIVMMLVLLQNEKERAGRSRYVALMALLLACVFHLSARMGFLTALDVPWTIVSRLIVVSVAGMAFSLGMFLENYYLGRLTRIGRANQIISGAGAVLMLIVPAYFAIYRVCAVALFLIILYGIYLSVRDLSSGRGHAYNPVLVVALMVTMIGGAADLLTEIGILVAPRLSGTAIACLGVVSVIVVLADFLELTQRNKELLVAAEESTRLKREFLASVSHELRTPLNAIINIPDGLLEQFGQGRVALCQVCASKFALDADEVAPSTCPECGGALVINEGKVFQGNATETYGYLETVRHSGHYLLTLVNDILDVSKMEAGRMSIRPEPTDLVAIIEDALANVRMQAEAKRIVLRSTHAESALPIVADGDRMTQVLVNLLSNALKFSPDASTIEVAVQRQEGSYVVSVRDSGPGIAPEHQTLIFESFRQVDGSHQRKHRGSGLGLSISKHFVELHGGKIWVESVVGAGSTFFVQLPREAHTHA